MNIKKFSNEQLAGQRLIVGFEGKKLNQELKFLIEELKIGGVILFSNNLSAPEQIKNLCSSVQEYARSCGQPPLFIAVDQEGGEVARLKDPFTQFPGNPSMKNVKDAEKFAKITAKELSEVGINMNMAPVMDVIPEDLDSIMAGRVFGNDPAFVSKMGVSVIKHLQQNGIMAVAKHFPGIGKTALDSHNDLPILTSERSELESFDYLPFSAAIKAGVSAIMLSHILYSKIDLDWPASLSVHIAKGLLRDHLGFKGLVMTDDLDMGAVVKNFNFNSVIHQILSSEIDIVLICHKGPNIKAAFKKILERIEESFEVMERGVASVQRIMALKRQYL
ncbi:MAG: beta-N-acetylhexosaminidase [Deltaproteobacteria bacterium]|nr:beta-N-acetylhexosaminidase [Deltaproteobacteria bacterium]